MVYYLGTDGEAPLAPDWDKMAPAFYVSSVGDTELASVKGKLHHRNLRYLGSHNGCGCGFRSYRDGVLMVGDAEYAETRADHVALSRYLAGLEKSERAPQIFGCWSGDESDTIEFERTIKANDILNEDFGFREREILTLRQ